jgi:hypothetical protein
MVSVMQSLRQRVYTGGQQMGNPPGRVKSLAEI